MKIRDMHASINDVNEVYEMPSGGIEILAEDGRTLFTISFREGKPGQISVSAEMACKHDDQGLDTGLNIKPIAANVISMFRDPLV